MNAGGRERQLWLDIMATYRCLPFLRPDWYAWPFPLPPGTRKHDWRCPRVSTVSVVLVLLYLAAAVAANLSVTFFGPISTPINAFVLIALDLVTRDALHERWQEKLWSRMFMLIAAGSVISYLLNAESAQVALASTVAFLATGAADTVMYQLLHRFPRLKRVVGSNAVSALVDSTVFPTIAFGHPIWWVTASQWAAKVFGGYLWALIFTKTIWREREQAAHAV